MKLKKLWKLIDKDTNLKIVLPSGENFVYLKALILIGTIDQEILDLEVAKIGTDYDGELYIELKEGVEE